LPNLPIVVVFPTPLTPAIKITLGLFCLISSNFFSRGDNISAIYLENILKI